MQDTFLDKIKDNLRHCKSFALSLSFIKKADMHICLYEKYTQKIELELPYYLKYDFGLTKGE